MCYNIIWTFLKLFLGPLKQFCSKPGLYGVHKVNFGVHKTHVSVHKSNFETYTRFVYDEEQIKVLGVF